MLESGIVLQNRYEIIEPIGKGGMGAVYLARDQRLGNTIALKETFFNDTLMVAAFEREARLLAGLRHGALPKVIDHFIDANGQFLVMEFIPGEDLEGLLQSSTGAFQMEEVLQWADQILDALDYLHSQDPPIIHRDIKPQNLKLSSRNQVVLLDFGLAKNTAPNASTTTSGKSIFAYTPIYAPLEQIQNAGTDARSDIYSLGATLFHLLTGEKPVDALSRAGDFLNGKVDPLAYAHERNPRISPAVGEVIAQAMALNRDLRPASAIVMRKLLRDAVQSPAQDASMQGKTIMSQTKAFHTDAASAFSGDLTHKGGMPLRTQGQASPKTGANAGRPLATHNKPVTPNYKSANTAAQSPWNTTPAWNAPSTVLQTNSGSGKGKWVASALLLIVFGTVLAFKFSGNATPASEIKPTNNALIEQSNMPSQSDAGAKTSAPVFESQTPTSSPVTMPERASTPTETTQPAAAEKSATTETVTTPKTETETAKQEPAKTEPSQTQTTQQTQQAAKPTEPMRQEERRPPPPPPPHMGPPPPHGGPPPHERRRP